ncbi:hypothetical protein AvCA_19050 [Azotobacter vinelandii CA]|uniref:Uncharacterized protein n=2 Tax=Azotobacter vinelandii TaxID=354 RepID=C1DED2_AZOVD|nr:hypothetical protein Avin_19050 [Azotobacter vinelandii DJ]AGK16848.1 hypothetical protein AvCA_19050 [Azotobacter vinelandii CA]AGK20269.1 hypothetical protein AvCA6_19050 [Azotobacter vinelandii CA6]
MVGVSLEWGGILAMLYCKLIASGKIFGCLGTYSGKPEKTVCRIPETAL